MSATKIEVKAEDKIYEIAFWDVVKIIKSKEIPAGFLGRNPIKLDETCVIRVNDSEWQIITDELRNDILEADTGQVIKILKTSPEQKLRHEQERQRKQEAEALQQQEAQALAVGKIHQLKAKCASGEWSLDDLQYIFQLVSNVPTTSSATSEEVDELAQAQNELINDVCKNPALSEPLKIMYANAQLGMQQQILNNLEQLSSNQAQSNTILKQSQKSRNLIGAAGMLGATRALSELGDISDALGGDE